MGNCFFHERRLTNIAWFYHLGVHYNNGFSQLYCQGVLVSISFFRGHYEGYHIKIKGSLGPQKTVNKIRLKELVHWKQQEINL